MADTQARVSECVYDDDTPNFTGIPSRPDDIVGE